MNGTKRKFTKRRAFSLVEVAMSLGLLSFCMVAIMGLIPVALQSVGNTINTTVRLRMIQATRSELLNMPFSTLSGTSFAYDADGIAVTGTASTGGNVQSIRYEVTAAVTGTTSIPGGALNSMDTVQITGSNVVTHQTYTGQFHLPDNGL